MRLSFCPGQTKLVHVRQRLKWAGEVISLSAVTKLFRRFTKKLASSRVGLVARKPKQKCKSKTSIKIEAFKIKRRADLCKFCVEGQPQTDRATFWK